MNLYETLRTSMNSLRANRLRVFLTLLGIVIGVFLIFVLLSAGSGAMKESKKIISDVAPNAVAVVHGYFPLEVGLGDISFSPSKMLQKMGETDAGIPFLGSEFEPEMASALQRELPEGCFVTPLSIDIKNVTFGSRSRTVIAYATNEYYPQVRDQEVMDGSYFSRKDRGRRVCVLGSYLKDQIFGDVDPVGREIRMGGQRFQVVGVLEPKGMSFVLNNDDLILVPYWIGGHQGGSKTDGFLITTPTPESMREVKGICNTVLERLVGEKEFTVVTQDEMVAVAGDVTHIVDAMNSVILILAFLVGGIGIMNIMLVAVTERIREIGIRKAHGAKSKDILKQFLVESLMLGVAGGIIGIPAGIAYLKITGILFDYPPYIGTNAIVLALVFSVAIGTIFGVWPALKAARLDPVESLRH